MIVRTGILFALALMLSSCADGPREITIGAEECAHCRMIVSEERFAAQLRTEHGRTHVFDSIECMAEFIQEDGTTDTASVRGLWVTDFTQPENWVSAPEAHYLRSPELRSPMGINLSAFASDADVQAHQAEYGGEVLDWDQVRELVAGLRVASGHNGQSHVH